MNVATLLRTHPDADLARLARVLVPLVLNKSWNQAERVVALWEKIVTAEQAWYWTPEWQTAEAEADTELANGQFDDFASMDALIADLQSTPR